MKYSAYDKYKESGVAWLGKVPEHWEVKRGRFAMRVNPPSEVLRDLNSESEISFVPMDAVGEYGGIRLDQTRVLAEVGGGYTEFQDGDVVVAKITPCFENGKGALVQGLVNGAAYGTTELHVLRVQPNLNERYLFYTTLTDGFRSFGESEMYGAGGQKRVPPEFCKDFPASLPPLPEQTAIADFLDRETGRIDTLVAKKRQLLDLLKEKRTALISRTVTRGLPADIAREFGLEPHTRFKDSGIEWLGEVPEGWEVLPFTKYVADKSDYRGKTPEKTDTGVFLVTAKNIRMGYIDYDTSKEYISEADYGEVMRRGLPKYGDILFTTEAPLGNVALVDKENVAMAQRIIRFRMKADCFDSKFTLYGMMSDYFQNQLKSLSTGSTAEGLKASKLTILKLVGPPFPEQTAIATYLDRETAKIDQLTEKVESAITRLQEYRTALITAAVTGKIDVRNKENKYGQ